MAPQATDVLVVGAGIAGWRVASALRREGFAGTVYLVGAEPHLPYDRPPLSKSILSGAAQPESTHLVGSGDLAERDISWRCGARATSLDTDARRVGFDDGTAVEFDQLVIATGATPRTLPGMASGVHVLRTLDDSESLRSAAAGARRICVLGGGVLGCEVASTLSTFASTTIIEAARSLLARLCLREQMTDLVTDLHKTAGLDVRVGSAVREVLGTGHVTGVACADGTVVDADLLVVALGVVPSTSWLDGSGIAVDDGVLCDQYLRTNIDGVFAIGDVARKIDGGTGETERLEHWTSATEQAEVAAYNIIGRGGEMVSHTSLPYVWSDQHGRKLQIIGRPGIADADHAVALNRAEHRGLTLYSRSGRLVGAAALGMPRPLVKLRRLVEAQATVAEATAAAGIDDRTGSGRS